jgi:hypothetical protein
MAKSKKKALSKQSKPQNKTKVQKLARQAGKIAAQAERIARDAVDKAVHASTMVVDVIGHPADSLSGALSAGKKTAGDLGTGAQELLESSTTAVANSELVASVSQIVDERVHATLSALGLATNAEVEALKRRIAELEGKRPARSALPAKPAVKKAAAAKAPGPKAAAAKTPAVKQPAAPKKAPARKPTSAKA